VYLFVDLWDDEKAFVELNQVRLWSSVYHHSQNPDGNLFCSNPLQPDHAQQVEVTHQFKQPQTEVDLLVMADLVTSQISDEGFGLSFLKIEVRMFEVPVEEKSWGMTLVVAVVGGAIGFGLVGFGIYYLFFREIEKTHHVVDTSLLNDDVPCMVGGSDEEEFD